MYWISEAWYSDRIEHTWSFWCKFCWPKPWPRGFEASKGWHRPFLVVMHDMNHLLLHIDMLVELHLCMCCNTDKICLSLSCLVGLFGLSYSVRWKLWINPVSYRPQELGSLHCMVTWWETSCQWKQVRRTYIMGPENRQPIGHCSNSKIAHSLFVGN
jgi:hypothetical protein